MTNWEPSDEVQAARRCERDASRTRKRAYVSALKANLAAITDPILRSVIDLHHPLPYLDDDGCAGCLAGDFGPPDWPCETIRLVGTHFGLKAEPTWFG